MKYRPALGWADSHGIKQLAYGACFRIAVARAVSLKAANLRCMLARQLGNFSQRQTAPYSQLSKAPTNVLRISLGKGTATMHGQKNLMDSFPASVSRHSDGGQELALPAR
jgi:hypothetical protein